MHILILGCGFTGEAVAKRFLSRGAKVTATTRDTGAKRDWLQALGATVVPLEQVPGVLAQGTRVLHSLPPVGQQPGIPPYVTDLLDDRVTKVVYLSTTGVYGAAEQVNEQTPVDLSTERARIRVEEEERVRRGAWKSLILRPAAIYGPGRGAHESYRRGSYPIADNYVSRIHVADLAAHVEAGLVSDLTGTFPVADEEPCTSREIYQFCAKLLGENKPAGGGEAPTGPIRFSGNRRVDGSAVRRVLGIELLYPSYRVGIPACLSEAST